MDTKPKPDDEPTPDTGIPPGVHDAEPKGQPSSDRHKTETTPHEP